MSKEKRQGCGLLELAVPDAHLGHDCPALAGPIVVPKTNRGGDRPQATDEAGTRTQDPRPPTAGCAVHQVGAGTQGEWEL